MNTIHWRTVLIVGCAIYLARTPFSEAGVVNHVGSYTNWTTSWTVLGGGNDPDDGKPAEFDFVGDNDNPGLYYANSADYVFFRLRLDADTFTPSTARGAHLVLIDVQGYDYGRGFGVDGTNDFDYAFAWDSKSADLTKHGLEMGVRSARGPTWGDPRMDDIDGDPSTKLSSDINGFDAGVQRTTDGYVRTTDGQETLRYGPTTFLDIAVSWSYLQANTDLRKDQTWRIAVASINNATDHNAFNADIGGTANPTSLVSVGWSEPVDIAAVPEPTGGALLAVGAAIFLIRRRFTG